MPPLPGTFSIKMSLQRAGMPIVGYALIREKTKSKVILIL